MEVMRDKNDNVVIICSIENLDADGRPHRRQHHRRADPDADRQGIPADARRRASRVIRAVGVETGGSNIQFAHQPRQRRHGRRRDEPARVAVSALASKATGYPIAKIAAKLAVGYTLDELPNYITRRPRTLHVGVLRADDRLLRDQDPALDVRKVPGRRRDADHADEERRRGDGDRPTFKEALQKGIRSMEVKRRRLDLLGTIPGCRGVRRALDCDRGGSAARRPAGRGDAGAACRGDRRAGPRGTKSIRGSSSRWC